MIDKLWFSRHWLGRLLWPLLWVLSQIYKGVSAKRKAAYLSGQKESYRAPVPVVVVGNITAGGNGKTPIVVWLVESLLKLGYRPGVVSRGYGAKSPYYPLVLQENTPSAHCGDEPKLIYQRTHVPIAVSPNRSDAVRTLLPLGVNIIIADDGLQHYALQRDVEFIVVDGQRRFGNGKTIPLGPLREPVSRCDDVDFVINNGGHAERNEIAMSLAPSLAVNLKTLEQANVSELGALAAFAGIGFPPRFFSTLQSLGANLIATKGFADHKVFEKADIIEFSASANNVIMTEKDAVKCQAFAQDNWWYLPVSATFEAEKEQYILNHIQEVIEQYGSSST